MGQGEAVFARQVRIIDKLYEMSLLPLMPGKQPPGMTITTAALGNRDYHTPRASGYFNYFGTAAGQVATGPQVWVEDGLTRVFKNDPARINSNISLDTAKNEYEPFQIIVKAPASNNLTNVNVTISDLSGPNGAFISADNINLYREHYLYVTQGSKSSNATTNSPLGPGWYPDALIPFTDPVTDQDLTGQLDAVPFNLAAGENQPIWVDIYTPADTPAGLYNGTATITSSQGTRTVQVSLNVWNFTLPIERSLHGSTNTIQSLRSRTTAIELLKHRFNPKIVDRADERFLIDNYGLDMVHVFRSGGASYGNCQTDPAPLVSDVLKATANHEPELYLYTSYANEVWDCNSLFPEFLAWATNLRLGGSHPAIVTFPVNELMGADLDNTAADIWSVLPKHYDQAKSHIETLINHPSTQVWSYNPLVQDGYSPKFTIDFLPINARIMQGFINQSLGLTGTKFWRVDYWTNDPWNNAEAYRVDAPGEGHMVYPGEDVGLADQIVSGVRMKWFREGSEDYEYIQILRDLGQEQFALDTTRTVAVDFHTWSQDKDVLYVARKLLGEKIHSLSSDSTQIIRVPADAPTIQAAIDLASDGDVVRVAPGMYQENIQIAGKTITLASRFYNSQDPSFIDQTIIDGDGNTVIKVGSSVGPETKIMGFTIQNGDDGISASAKLHILHNRFSGNKDAIDYEGGGGVCRYNLFEDNSDDAVDLDGPTEVTIDNNIMRNNGDDGLEIRLHAYSGPSLDIVIRHNIISGNGEDGIQLIDHPGESNRVFVIERNLIKDSAMVGLGLMDNGDTEEDFRGASIADRIHLFNNTFVDNDHSLTGGDNLIALNNIFAGSTNIALKNVAGNSIAAYNLFWGNGKDHQNSNVSPATTILVDPLFDVNYLLRSGSPALDTGTASFTWNSEIVLDLRPEDYAGVAPDLGAYETYWLLLPFMSK